jgi:hypothetical protein
VPTLDLATEKPVAGTSLDANQVASGFQEIQNAVNGLDANNWAAGKIFAPSKLTQEGAAVGALLAWNGTEWAPTNSLVRTAGQTLLESKLLAGDANPAFKIGGDGKHEWGAGGGSATPDVNLYRSAVDVLKTDDSFHIAGIELRFLNALGAIINRVASPATAVMIAYRASGDTADRLNVDASGTLTWGGGSAAGDLTVGRNNVDVLALGAGDGLQFGEAAADLAAAPANTVRVYSRDSGGGKTQLVARFNTGAVQVLATEP